MPLKLTRSIPAFRSVNVRPNDVDVNDAMSSTMRWSGLSMTLPVLFHVPLRHPPAPLQHEHLLVVVPEHEHGDRARDGGDVGLEEAIEIVRFLLRD
eukprot:30721-Pelagococcus_subviridis.AAC.12